MVFQFLWWQPCSTKNMYYMLFLISLCAGLRVLMLNERLDLNKRVSSALTAITFFKFKPDPDTKYVLSWDSQYLLSQRGSSIFPSLNCPVNKCVFTADKNLLNKSDFDAVVFGDVSLGNDQRPEQRSPLQIFIYMSIESPYRLPACELYNDNYFNWTFTYRLDSDVLWRYFVVRDASGDIIAPATDVIWTKNVNHLGLKRELITLLQKKTKAVAWLANDCSTEGRDYMLQLEKHLHHFGLKIDKFKHYDKTSRNWDKSLTEYRFVLAFEDSFAEDYVTDKVMDGYRNYAVPVVYGGANYRWFLPTGSYINAQDKHPYLLAHAIYEGLNSQLLFQNYFKWTSGYSIEEWGTRTHSSLCDLCAALHEDRATYAPAIKNFRLWWNSPKNMHRCLPNEHLSSKHNVNQSESLHPTIGIQV